VNEQDLKTVFNKLSAQAESIRRMQDVSKQIEKLDYWIKTLKEKAAEIVTLGAVPVVDITARLSALEAEKKDLQSMLIPASAAEIRALVAGTGPTRAPVQETVWKDPLSEKDSAEMNALLHVIAITDLSDWEQEERWYQYESWACSWRIVVAKYSKEIHDRSPLLKEVYGKLRDIMRVYSPQLWYIQALDRKATLDWVDRLVECEETKDRLIRDRKSQIRNQEDAQEMALLVLKEAVREYREAPEEAMAEAQRKLKHCIRETARYRHLREEIGEIVAHLRTMLEGDFAFLWPKDEVVEESPATTLSNREIASRMMRRMKSKTLIGACHGPFDQIYKGFPEHDKGRAKILLQDLCRVGVVRAKYAQIGIRVSIEPKMMPIADKLIDMQDTGMESLESLMGEARV
jgi:hypothetical protein